MANIIDINLLVISRISWKRFLVSLSLHRQKQDKSSREHRDTNMCLAWQLWSLRLFSQFARAVYSFDHLGFEYRMQPILKYMAVIDSFLLLAGLSVIADRLYDKIKFAETHSKFGYSYPNLEVFQFWGHIHNLISTRTLSCFYILKIFLTLRTTMLVLNVLVNAYEYVKYA